MDADDLARQLAGWLSAGLGWAWANRLFVAECATLLAALRHQFGVRRLEGR